MSDSRERVRTLLARCGRIIFPRRLWVGLAVVVLAGFVVQPRSMAATAQPWPLIPGLLLVLLGLGVRAWAAGCAGRHTREARIEAPALITGGPFAFVRNPIYLASILLGFGMVILVGDPWLLGMHIGVCILLYAAIVPAEESFLRQRFGAPYQEYCQAVPRFLPRLLPWSGAAKCGWDWRALLDQMRLGLILGAIYTGLHLAAWLRR